MLSFDSIFPAKEVAALFSDRSVDFTLTADALGLSPAQADYLARHGGVSPQTVATIRQVHGGTVLQAPFEHGLRGSAPEADALVTSVPSVALTIRSADCLPVFLYDPAHHCIGLAHAGWRGSAQNIAAATLAAMTRQWKTRPSDVRVVLGPCIRLCCYAVGPEFQEVFPVDVSPRVGKFFLDLAAVNQRQLVGTGVAKDHILDTGLCTCCHDRFFSYRREGGWAGRHISVLMLRHRA